MRSHHIMPRRVLDTKIIATETPHLLLHDECLDVGHAEGGVGAAGRVEGLEEDRLRCVWFLFVVGECVWAFVEYGRIERLSGGGRGRCATRSTYTSSAIRNRVGRCAHWL